MIILFGLSLMTFGLTYILPSNPAEQLAESMGAGHDREVIAKIEEKYGLDKSFGEQYVNWLKGALHGDFGMSVKYAQPVSQVLGRKLPNTVKLAVASFILMILISFPLGILSAVYKDKKADYIIRFMSFIGISLPSFWVGMMMIYFFAVKMHWLPVGGSDSFKSLIMPSVTLSLSMSAYYIRRIRAVMVEQMNEEYINGCQARGMNRSPSSRQLKKYKFFLPAEIYLLAVFMRLASKFRVFPLVLKFRDSFVSVYCYSNLYNLRSFLREYLYQ